MSSAALSYREIGKRLGIPPATVILIEKRALAKLARIARRERMLAAELFPPPREVRR